MRAQQEGANGESFLKAINHLVDQSILGNPTKARKAQKDLIGGLNGFPFYDPVLFVIEYAQQILLSNNEPGIIKNASGFIADILTETGSRIADKGTRILNLSPKVVNTIAHIQEHDQKLQKSSKYRFLPDNYRRTLELFAGLAESAKNGIRQVELVFALPSTEGQDEQSRRESIKRFNQWSARFYSEARQSNSYQNPDERDKLVTVLKEEPECILHSGGKFINKKYADLSLSDIEGLPYPPRDEDLSKITDYVIAVLQTNSGWNHNTINFLFFDSTFMHGIDVPTTYKNQNLLSNLNYWQEQFITRLILGEAGGISDQQIAKVLKLAPDITRGLICLTAYLWTVHPYQLSPEPINSANAQHAGRRHLLNDLGIDQYLGEHTQEAYITSVYSDEQGLKILKSLILPLLSRRLASFGVLEKYKWDLSMIEKMIREYSFSDIHLSAIKDVFEASTGAEFIARLNTHSDEIGKINQAVWDSIFIIDHENQPQRIHYLPMKEGVNIVQFDRDSVPGILNLNDLLVRRAGSEQNWLIDVVFSFRNNIDYITIAGSIDQQGRLQLKAPLEKEVPGLYAMLNHIAVLAIHDLVIQERMGNAAPTPTREPITENSDQQNPVDQLRKKNVPAKSSREALPRKVQTDTALIKEVHRIEQTAPRRVELHKRRLIGVKDYQAAINLYMEAVAGNPSSEQVAWIKSEVEIARKRAYKISPGKLRTLPARFQLKHIIDPITGEIVFLETWVIEHTSPKPTPEELSNLTLLYQRYYKGSSALDFLSQMLPWFVGQ